MSTATANPPPLDHLPHDILLIILTYSHSPSLLSHTCKTLHSLWTTYDSVRARWLCNRYGKGFALYHPELAERHPWVGSRVVAAVVNLGGRWKSRDLCYGNLTAGGELKGKNINMDLMPLEIMRSLAIEVEKEAFGDISQKLDTRGQNDAFDLWLWLIRQPAKESIPLITRLVSSGANPNYQDSYALHHALKTQNLTLVKRLIVDLNATIPSQPALQSNTLPSTTPAQTTNTQQRSHPYLWFISHLLPWCPVSGLASFINCCEEQYAKESDELQPAKVSDQKAFWIQVGKFGRSDFLRFYKLKGRRDLSYADACAVFVGACSGGYLSLITEMILSYSVPADHSASLFLRSSIRLLRSDMLHASLHLGTTIPLSYAEKFITDLLPWASPESILLFLKRANTHSRSPKLEERESFLLAVGRYGRSDVISRLEKSKEHSGGWLTPERATTVLTGAAGGGYLDLIQYLITHYSADPSGPNCTFPAILAACQSLKPSSADIVTYLLTMWETLHQPDADERRYARRVLSNHLIESCKFVGRERKRLVEGLCEWIGGEEISRVGARCILEGLRSRQVGVVGVLEKYLARVVDSGCTKGGMWIILVDDLKPECGSSHHIYIPPPPLLQQEDIQPLVTSLAHLVHKYSYRMYVQGGLVSDITCSFKENGIVPGVWRCGCGVCVGRRKGGEKGFWEWVLGLLGFRGI